MAGNHLHKWAVVEMRLETVPALDIVISSCDNDKWVVRQFSQFLLILLPQAQQKITSSVFVSPASYIIE